VTKIITPQLITPEDAAAELGRRYMLNFVQNLKKDYQVSWHHEGICHELDLFIAGKTKNLLIFTPPQHGKSELTTRMLPAKLLGVNPNYKIGIMSYGATLAEQFNRDIQMRIDSPEYQAMYPHTYLNGANVVTSSKTKYLRNSTIFQTVGHNGYVITVGVDGVLTGYPIDIFIFDDLYKNRAEALSHARKGLITSVWDSVIIPRLHNESRILGTFTRWAEDDIGGMLMDSGNEFKVVKLPAIKEKRTFVAWDKRKEGEALWPDKHSLERLEKIRDNKRTAAVWGSMYQQDPKAPKELRIYPDFTIIDRMPRIFPRVTGLDFGWFPDPVAGVDIEVDMKNKRIFFDKIVYKLKTFEEEVADAYKKKGADKVIGFADCEDPKAIARLQQLYINLMKAFKGPGSLNAGILKLQEFELVVVESFTEAIEELNSYQWIPGPDGTPTSTPMDKKNHILDALRYGVTGYLRSINKF